ncbi:DUF177 domain-containing protein [Candidatus Peregrinibacteria bacterium]|nr:DUF177 domain-containing protein [Candidatus Peregrinibacteria bacterium]
MIKDITNVKIGQIWNQGQGATFKDAIEANPDFGPEIQLDQPISSDLTLIRMKDGVIAILEHLQTSSTLTCSKCLIDFDFQLAVSTTEREFLSEAPGRNYDSMEVFLINPNDMSIDLTETLRQELLLHFPMIPVCSERCKGLCLDCHVNLNLEENHDTSCQSFQKKEHETEESEKTYKPFANLKDIIK